MGLELLFLPTNAVDRIGDDVLGCLRAPIAPNYHFSKADIMYLNRPNHTLHQGPPPQIGGPALLPQSGKVFGPTVEPRDRCRRNILRLLN